MKRREMRHHSPNLLFSFSLFVFVGFSANPLPHFPIGLDDVAHIAAEAVLVETLAAHFVPKAAGVGADFVSNNETAVGGAAELQFKIDEIDSAIGENLD